MSKLTLQPTIADYSREEYENRLEGIRARRMVAAVAFYEGKNAKLQHASGIMKVKLEKQLDGLEKDLLQLDKLIERAEGRIARIEGYENDMGLMEAAMVAVDAEEAA